MAKCPTTYHRYKSRTGGPAMPELDIRDLTKSYGSVQALDGVSISVEAGSIVALLGNNGAGKSTLMSIAAGLIDADSGTVEVMGRRVTGRSGGPSPNLGLAPQSEALYPTLTVSQNLRYFGRLAGLRGSALRSRSALVATDLLIHDLLDRPARDLSGGQRRRLHTALALMHSPDVLLLDEPTIGVDIDSRYEMLDFVKRTALDGAAILYSTHQLNEVEQLDAQVVIIDEGRVLEAGRVDRLIEDHAPTLAELHLDADVDIGESLSSSIELTKPVDGGGVQITIRLDSHEVVVSDIVDQLSPSANGSLLGATIIAPSLEQAYLRITRAARTGPKNPDAVVDFRRGAHQ